MSSGFMLFIALCYCGACLAFIHEGKLAWATVAFCWGIGNAILGVISK